jgi:hypothetical protein
MNTVQPTLAGIEVVSEADNKWFGDMMILQALSDSENVNEQEREVLARWLAESVPPSQRNAAVPETDQRQVREDSQGLGEPRRLSPVVGVAVAPSDAEKLCWALRQFVKLVPAGDECRLLLTVGPQSFFIGIEPMLEDEAAQFAGQFVHALAGAFRQVACGVAAHPAPDNCLMRGGSCDCPPSVAITGCLKGNAGVIPPQKGGA